MPPSGGGHVPEPELERLSSILREFNDLFGAIAWQDTDRVKVMITETIPFRVAQDAAFKNARQNSDQDNARIEHGKALTRVMTALIKDDAELFKQFMDSSSASSARTPRRRERKARSGQLTAGRAGCPRAGCDAPFGGRITPRYGYRRMRA